MHAVGNFIEAGFWLLVAFLCVGFARRRQGCVRVRLWQAAIAFAVFGGSDWVEAYTGAWWRPWWLFVWKAVCVVLLLLLAVDHYRRQRGRTAG